ncbi:MAG: hypothetical protein MJK10_21035 [Pseudomonadales bacterium]|nr:hypothetical protein [Pseudomonadales bacterium]NRA18484.1 hypothetical protein [Oceanospirillaceae bacterium]
MKILSSEVGFNTQQSRETSEKYLRSSTATQQQSAVSPEQQMFINRQVELSYNARMRSQQDTDVESYSQIKQAGSESSYLNKQSTHAVTQTIIGLTATVSNLSIDDTRSSLLDPLQTKTYRSIEQLPRADRLNLGRSSDSPQTARLDIREQHIYTEKEQLHVGTQGRITTEDGRQIDFMLQLNMQRDFSLEQSLQIQSSERVMMDPLVINLGAGAASLTSNSFSFDLNADGHREQISFVGSGSGFLALDINEDGVINDGSELFGTQGQNGFAELANYDSDNNQWIDENDAIFDKLKVWTRDEHGQDQLVSLKEAGVGAIYLGSSVGSFDLTDAENNLLGQVKRSGVFLTENGQVASIQELDIAVHNRHRDSVIDQSINKLELQLDDWQDQAEQNNQQLFAARLDQQLELPQGRTKPEKEEKQPTLIDFLFPKPGSKYDKSAKRHHRSEQQHHSVTKRSSKNSPIAEQPERKAKKMRLDKNTFDMMQRLDKKTSEKLSADNDKYSHLRAIIEALVRRTETTAIK